MAGIEDFIRKQWPVLKNRVADLENRKRLIEGEMREVTTELEKARQEFRAIDTAAKTLQTNLSFQIDFEMEDGRFNNFYKYGDVSIKQAVRLTLDNFKSGLNSHDLFVALNRRYFEGKLERTSFSPQLSRLKAQGEVFWEKLGWVLTDKGRNIMGASPILPYYDEPDTNEPPSA